MENGDVVMHDERENSPRDEESQSDAVNSRMTRSRVPPKDDDDEGETRRMVGDDETRRAPMSHYGDSRIMHGQQYQAVIPECHKEATAAVDDADRDSCMWHPNYDALSAHELDDFVTIAKQRHAFTVEQALGLLHYTKYVPSEALARMAEFEPMVSKWSTEHSATFDQLFDFHGKHFNKIHQMMPAKSIAELVEHYYKTKKLRNRMSFLEKERIENIHAKDQSKNRRELIAMLTEGFKEGGSVNATSSHLENVWPHVSYNAGIKCGNCKRSCGHVNEFITSGLKQMLCNGCFLYQRRTNKPRPIDVDESDSSVEYEEIGNPEKKKPKLPLNHQVNAETFVNYGAPANAEAMAASSDGATVTPIMQGTEQAECMQMRMAACEQRIQSKRQKLEPLLKQQMTTASVVGKARSLKYTISNEWTLNDRVMAVKCFRRCGRDFSTIADIMGTKTSKQVGTFYETYKSSYQLDRLIDEYSAEMVDAMSKVTDEDVRQFGESRVNEVVDLSDDNAVDKAMPVGDDDDIIML